MTQKINNQPKQPVRPRLQPLVTTKMPPGALAGVRPANINYQWGREGEKMNPDKSLRLQQQQQQQQQSSQSSSTFQHRGMNGLQIPPAALQPGALPQQPGAYQINDPR